MKVLLVEDCEIAIEFYKVMIGKYHNLVIARDYLEFQKAMDEMPLPDVVLTDFNFPHGDGNKVAMAARNAGVKNIFLQSTERFNVKKILFDQIFSKCTNDIVVAIRSI